MINVRGIGLTNSKKIPGSKVTDHSQLFQVLPPEGMEDMADQVVTFGARFRLVTIVVNLLIHWIFFTTKG